MRKEINRILEYFGYRIIRLKKDNRFLSIYNKYKEYTMIPEDIYLENLRLCATHSLLKGDIIECGTWKGGMIAGMAEVLGSEGRCYYLFDSFEGLPEVEPIDGLAAKRWQENRESENYYNNCKADLSFARDAMARSGASDVIFVKGWFKETLPAFECKREIAILRLDGDWYDSIAICLQYLYPHVAYKGVIIVDDYYVWEGTSRAVHDYLCRIGSVSKINSLFGGVAYIIKEDINAVYS